MFKRLCQLTHSESFGGILLFIATLIAILMANSAISSDFLHFWEYKLGIHIFDFFIGFSLHHWINEVLMSLFFFTVGLEIKREFLRGELSGLQKASFPIIAAVGGMLIPASLYLVININGDYSHGFGIPMATDIAFALGVASLLGSRISTSLKLFLVTLAVVDDLGAVLVIAFFYTGEIFWSYLVISCALIIVLIILHYFRVQIFICYLIPGVLLWLCIYASGIHVTISAVILAFSIPIDGKKNKKNDPGMLERLEHLFHPYSVYLVMPLFALANAGVRFDGFAIDLESMQVFFGILVGLMLGKPFGIFLLCFICDKIKIAKKPETLLWRHIFGAGLLAGIGFTMSIFVTHLAFDNQEVIKLAKVAILCASFLAALIGSALLFFMNKPSK